MISQSISSVGNIHSGASYFIQGLKLIRQKGLRRFVIAPLLINFILFATAFYYLLQKMGTWIEQFIHWLPEMLSWLSHLIWPLAIITVLVIFSLFFTTIANIIASPFNGLLAEKVQLKLTGQPVGTLNLNELLKEFPRSLKREWQKIAYYFPRAALLLLLFLIPVIGQSVAPILWFLFAAWMMSIQYIDFSFDNNRIEFKEMKKQLQADKSRNLGLGVIILACSSIPLINLVVMPIAVCATTAMYVDHYNSNSNN